MSGSRRARALVAAIAAFGLLGFLPAGAQDAGPPADFIAMADQLSQPAYPEIITEPMRVTAHDGVDVYVEVTRPDPAVHPGPWPVILEASPYHGTIADRQGNRIFPDPTDPEGNKLGLTGYFAPRGYAVVMMDLRGTGRSGGCLDHLGPNDGRDLKTVVEWAAEQEWSTGLVGMTGHSYVGSTPSIAAAQRPRGLVTIAPSAGLASMYDHQFHFGVPWFLQYVGPQAAYEALALGRHLPPGTSIPLLNYPNGDDFGNHVTDTGCGMQNSALLAGSGQVTGQYELWHAQRDWRALAADVDIPVFMIHGVNDNAARIPAAEWFFGGRFDRSQDKIWIGQWDHGSGGNTRCADAAQAGHVNCRFDQWQYALHAWFDKHLQGRDVDTGPAVEAFLNHPVDDAAQGPVYTATAWRRPAEVTQLYLDATDLSLRTTPPTENAEVSFRLDRRPINSGPEGPTFTSQPLAADTVFLGLARLQLQAALSSAQVAHLVTRVDRIDAHGFSHPMGYCAIQPSLRFGVQTLAPVVPGQEMTLRPQCFTLAHYAEAGDSIAVTVAASTPHHVVAAQDVEMTIFTGPSHASHTRLPSITSPTVYPDVPRFEK